MEEEHLSPLNIAWSLTCSSSPRTKMTNKKLRWSRRRMKIASSSSSLFVSSDEGFLLLRMRSMLSHGFQGFSPKTKDTALPPNFVHSLDGSHMMMTAIACKNAGLSFAGVHDSFWTHASYVDRMNIILRKQFVELYYFPINLENVSSLGCLISVLLNKNFIPSIDVSIFLPNGEVAQWVPDVLPNFDIPPIARTRKF